MYQANCPVCKKKSIRYGKDHAGSQRWYCKECRLSFTQKIDKKNYDHSVQIRSRSTVPCLYQAISKRKSMFWELPVVLLENKYFLFSTTFAGCVTWNLHCSCLCLCGHWGLAATRVDIVAGITTGMART